MRQVRTGYGISWAVRFSVTGAPVAQPRTNPSLLRRKGGALVTDKNGRPIITHHVNKEHPIGGWKDRIIRAYQHAITEADIAALVPVAPKIPMALMAQFCILRPTTAKRWERWKSTRPDADNYVKAVMDALQFADLYVDDGQIVHLDAKKILSDSWQGVTVLIVAGDAVNLFANTIIRDRTTAFSDLAAGDSPVMIESAMQTSVIADLFAGAQVAHG